MSTSKPSGIESLASEAEFKSYTENRPLSVVHFWAPWAKQCETMDEAVAVMMDEMPDVGFAKVEAEEVPAVSMAMGVSAVPTFLFLSRGKLLDRLEGAKAADLAKKVRTLAAKAKNNGPDAAGTLDSRLRNLVRASKCVLFMKGDRHSPKCGFSRQTIDLLDGINANYDTYDVLGDDEVRQGLKRFSDWPTYPQLYVDGELVGGLDILKEMSGSNELSKVVPLKKDLKELVNRAHTMVFMKGSPDQPKCGFSRQLVEILREVGVDYDTFDILEDEEVRQGLKKFSDWPTYPQVYVEGELVGGLDIIKDLKESGDLVATLKGGQ